MNNIDNAEWRVEAFSVLTKITGEETIAGWRWKIWGLDFRVYCDDSFEYNHRGGWNITHVPTGRRIGGALVPLDKAKEFVRQIDDLGDWSNIKIYPQLKIGLNEIRDASNGNFVFRNADFGPFFANYYDDATRGTT